MLKYQKTIEVSKKDLDELNHVNNIRYLQWVQEISKEHWEINTTIPDRENYVWVVRNHNINYHQSAVLGDILQITTKVLDWRGPISKRQVEIKNNKNGQLLVIATTEWCSIHPKTGKPMRAPKEIISLFCNDI